MLRAPPAGPAPGLTPGARAAAPSSATLNGSALVGLLAQLALSDRPAAPPSLVEGLGRWLGWREAIAVSAVLQAAPDRPDGRFGAGPGSPTGPSAPPSAAPTAVPAGAATAAARLQAEVQRVRETLARRIEEALKEAPEDGSDFLQHRRRYFGAQQAMELSLAPLREQARALLARCGPALAQLAALDAALAGALDPREQALLAQLPVLLEKHHTRLRETAPAAAPALTPETPAAPAPAARTHKPQATPAWLTTFRHDMRRMLQAELELRLQPTLGLLDALRALVPGSPGSA